MRPTQQGTVYIPGDAQPYPSPFDTTIYTRSQQALATMCASYNAPSTRETKRHRSNWLSSCCGIFEDYDPVIYHPEAYTASPAVARVMGGEERLPRCNNWLNSCCGILEDYDPVIYHPGIYSASPASTKGVGAEEETQVSGSLWRKNILMGGKCKLPDYSGVIIYDSAGTLVSNSKPPRLALTWK